MKPKTPHRHAEIIKAWANGYEIQIKDIEDWWIDIDNPQWNEDSEYRVKPEREYPVTSFTQAELFEIYNDRIDDTPDALQRVANAAIKRHIDDKQIDGKENRNYVLTEAVEIVLKVLDTYPHTGSVPLRQDVINAIEKAKK